MCAAFQKISNKPFNSFMNFTSRSSTLFEFDIFNNQHNKVMRFNNAHDRFCVLWMCSDLTERMFMYRIIYEWICVFMSVRLPSSFGTRPPLFVLFVWLASLKDVLIFHPSSGTLYFEWIIYYQFIYTSLALCVQVLYVLWLLPFEYFKNKNRYEKIMRFSWA